MAIIWSGEPTLRFVQLYCDHVSLRNKYSRKNHNHEVRNASMQAIVDNTKLPDLTVKYVPKEIKASRSTYREQRDMMGFVIAPVHEKVMGDVGDYRDAEPT